MRHALILGGALAFLACAPLPKPGCADDVHGIVRLVGASPASGVVLESAQGDVFVSGPLTQELERAQGLEVQASGPCTGARLAVERYRVLALGGAGVADGVLRAAGEAWALETADGAVHLPHVPAALAEEAGQRVWVLAGENGSVLAWGILSVR